MSCLSQTELRRDIASDLLLYTRLCNPAYRISHVHNYIAARLQQVAERKIRRLIVSIPPQHGKSALCSIEFPTWLLARDPSQKIVVASYGQDLANRDSREARARMMQDTYAAVTNTRLDPSNQSVDNWGVIGGGSYRAVGVGGGLTGHSSDCIIIDDPFRSPEDAHSQGMRDRVWDWFLSVAYTRLSPDGVIIIICTRWHVDDLVGRLTDPKRAAEMADMGVKGETWETVNLEALAPDSDPLGRAPGEALWPERYDVERLKAIRQTVGSYPWAALYCGRPTVLGGNYIKSSDFVIRRPIEVPLGLRWMRFWDLATAEKEQADFTAGVRGALAPDGTFWLADMMCRQMDWPKSRALIAGLAESEKVLVGIEAVGGFKTAFSNLREVVAPTIKLMEIGADTDKLTRALPWIALAEAGKVNLVQGEWIGAFLAEAEAFPNGQHDDMVDAVSGVYGMLTRGRKILVA